VYQKGSCESESYVELVMINITNWSTVQESKVIAVN